MKIYDNTISKKIIDVNNNKVNRNTLSQYLELVDMLTDPGLYGSSGKEAIIKSTNLITTYVMSPSNSILNCMRKCSQSNTIPVSIPVVDESKDRGFMTMLSFAVNNKSSKKQEALDLLKYLADNTVFISPSRKAFNACINNSLMPKNISKELIEAMERTIENLTYSDYSISNGIKHFIYQEMHKYYEKTMSKEEVINAISDMIWLYLNE